MNTNEPSVKDTVLAMLAIVGIVVAGAALGTIAVLVELLYIYIIHNIYIMVIVAAVLAIIPVLAIIVPFMEAYLSFQNPSASAQRRVRMLRWLRDRLISVGVGILGVLCCWLSVWLLVEQVKLVFHWLRTGIRQSFSVVDALLGLGIHGAWLLHPTDWIGLHQVLSATPAILLAVLIGAVAVLWVWSWYPLAGSPGHRSGRDPGESGSRTR